MRFLQDETGNERPRGWLQKEWPLWPFGVAFYLLAGFVVAQSLQVETARQCPVSSRISLRQQVWTGAFWPLTASVMMFGRMDPVAFITNPTTKVEEH